MIVHTESQYQMLIHIWIYLFVFSMFSLILASFLRANKNNKVLIKILSVDQFQKNLLLYVSHFMFFMPPTGKAKDCVFITVNLWGGECLNVINAEVPNVSLTVNSWYLLKNFCFVFVKGDYVIVDPIEEGEKVKAEISFILYKDHIQYLRKQQQWWVGPHTHTHTLLC